MKKILIYGDSNTWGDNFITGMRIPYEKQWANILQNMLGNDYKIIQEGLPGRVAGNIELENKFKNGKDSFISIYKSAAPIDILIIALGTNDLQIKYNRNSNDIIEDLLWYESILKEMFNGDDKNKYFNNSFPKVIYILPSNIDYKDRANIIFNLDSENKRKEIINYFNNNKIININIDNMQLVDGIHFNYDDHIKMANEVYNEIKK